MAVSTTSIGILVAIIVVGLLVCVVLCKSKKQREAAATAFIALLLIWLVFLVVVEIFKQYFTVVPFAVISIFIPVLFYGVLMQGATKREPGNETVSSCENGECRSGDPIAEVLPRATREEPATRATSEASTNEPRALRAVTGISEPVSSALLETMPPVKEIAPATISTSFEKYHERAEIMASRGSWSLAAALFEKSSRETEESAKKAQALFSAISSYLKAAKPGDAKRLAGQLALQPQLSLANSRKLRVVMKMLP